MTDIYEHLGHDQDHPKAMVQRTGTKEWGPMAWEAWVDAGLTVFRGEYGTYAWTRRGAERKARRLMRKYLGLRRGPAEEVPTDG